MKIGIFKLFDRQEYYPEVSNACGANTIDVFDFNNVK